jgi:hypothetical protein
MRPYKRDARVNAVTGMNPRLPIHGVFDTSAKEEGDHVFCGTHPLIAISFGDASLG